MKEGLITRLGRKAAPYLLASTIPLFACSDRRIMPSEPTIQEEYSPQPTSIRRDENAPGSFQPPLNSFTGPSGGFGGGLGGGLSEEVLERLRGNYAGRLVF